MWLWLLYIVPHIVLCITGRIHSAVISGINRDSRSVTVEWYEKGETKGKEVGILGVDNVYLHIVSYKFFAIVKQKKGM